MYYLEATGVPSPDRPGLVEPDGTWWGALSESLGLLDRTVEAASLTTLLAGSDPTNGEVLDPRHSRVKVAAFDCTFAAPKSVSVLHALGAGSIVEEVRASHERAVDGVLGYLERHAAHVRRSGALVPAPGFAAASFLHRTSRADDPHLHTHLVVANLAPDANGRWSAIDARPLFAHAGAAGALYRAQLRHEISRRLSITWQTRAEGFADLIGIPPAALRGFSRRSAEIAAELARTGWSGAHSARFAADRTRADKNLGDDYPTLVAAWRERAFSLGVSRTTVSRLGVPAARTAGAEYGRDEVPETCVAAAAESLGRPFDRRELIRASCARLADGAPVGRVEAAVDALLGSGELVGCGERALRLRAPGGGRIPGGLVEARFETRDVAALTARLANVLESAPVLGGRPGSGFLVGSSAVLTGVFATNPEVDALRVLATVREAALSAHHRGRRVVGLASDRRTAAHFEAATGIATYPLDRREALGGDYLVTIANPERCPVREVVALVDRARAGAMGLVLVRSGVRSDRASGRVREDSAKEVGLLPGQGESLVRHTVGGVDVVLAGDLVAAVNGIRLLREEHGLTGRRSLVVAAEPRSLGDLGFEVTSPAEALRRHRVGNLDLIVFGGARILGSGIAHVPDGERSHMAVLPVDRGLGSERSIALELAEPSAMRRELGRFPDARRAREVWRAKARSWEVRDGSLRIARVAGRDELVRATRTRVLDLSRGREPSLSR